MVYSTACADQDSASDGSFAPLQVRRQLRPFLLLVLVLLVVLLLANKGFWVGLLEIRLLSCS